MIKAIFQTLLTVFLITIVAFGYYIFEVWRLSYYQDVPAHANAIIVLTGGSKRIDTAYKLYENGHAPYLYISGTHPSNSVKDIVPQVTPALFNGVILDPVAEDTRNNAAKSAEWIRKNNFTSVIIVTSDYHMPRALNEFQAELSDVALHHASVSPENLPLFEKKTLQLFGFEGSKYWGSRIETFGKTKDASL